MHTNHRVIQGDKSTPCQNILWITSAKLSKALGFNIELKKDINVIANTFFFPRDYLINFYA